MKTETFKIVTADLWTDITNFIRYCSMKDVDRPLAKEAKELLEEIEAERQKQKENFENGLR